jgi:pyridoxamine 5'-phosphate oxidase
MRRGKSGKGSHRGVRAALERCPADPLILFSRWYRDAERAGEPLAEAMALATATRDGRPSVRMVLHRGPSRDGLVFYTNYNSRKASDLFENPRAAVVFHWPRLERQVRVEGRVEKLSRAESERYFQTRPRESRISAWASPQSARISARSFLVTEYDKVSARFGDEEIPCPPFWGGFRIVAKCIEFWQGQPHRLHDRVLYFKKRNVWTHFRLGP